VKHVLKTLLYVVACVLMCLAALLILLVAALVSSQVALSLKVAPVALAITQAMPAGLAFWGVVSSPLGGVFRTDILVVAVAAFVLAKVVRRVGRSL
jgi:hypothetical protein